MFEHDIGVLMRELVGIYAVEHENVDAILLNPMMIGTDRDTRDRMLYRLYKRGYIDGITVVNEKGPIIVVDEKKLSITIDGIRYLVANRSRMEKVLTEWQEEVSEFFKVFLKQ